MFNSFIKRKQEKVLILLLIPLTFILQSCLTKILPAKYFYDSNVILMIVRNSRFDNIYDNSYVFIAKIFRNINFFNFTEFTQWAFCISSITILLIVAKLYKKNNITIDKLIFIYITIILQNIYVFRISKDIVQELVFIIIDLIIINQHIKDKYKIILVLAVLIWEASVYRYYYYITAAFFILIYLLIKNIKKVNLKKVIAIFLIVLCIGLIGLKNVNRKQYNELIYIRVKLNKNREESPDAVTAINDLIKNNGNVFVYIANYFINLVRVLFPIELLLKGVKYIPFIIYQIYITIRIVRLLKMIKHNELQGKDTMLLSILVAYLLVATLHEPDFGSFIRHESTLAFIMFDLFIKNQHKENNLIENKENDYEQD